MIYLTGDVHGRFKRLKDFCEENNTTSDDIMILLGDVGVNFTGDRSDIEKKKILFDLQLTFFCIHGNHEMRPDKVEGYKEEKWHGGIVYVEKEYPNILFGKDGEIFDFAGKKAIVIGGAYSIDKFYRKKMGYPWFDDEQPSDEIKRRVEQQLKKNDWHVDIVLSHTVPLKYEPKEVFLSGIDQNMVDKSTERWLDLIEEKLDYSKWYAGHYHTEKQVEKLEILYNNYVVL